MAKIAAAAAPTPPPAPAPASAPEPIKKRKRSWIQLVGLLLLLLAGGGGAAWYVLTSKAAEAPVAKAPAKPVFETLEPFTVNLSDESGDHYLQVGIVYHIASTEVAENMKLYMPILRNRLLLLLSGKRAAELATVEGKKRLVEELVVAAREILPGDASDKGVVTALLASFVIQ